MGGNSQKRGKKALSEYQDFKGPTLMLVLINVIIFIITSILSGSIITIGGTALILFGLSWDLLIQGFIWTPVTSIFTHGGIAHLIGNLLFLIIYGFKLEEEGTTDRQIIFSYIITGVLAGLVSAPFLNSFQVGASGSVFGLLGVTYGRSKDDNPRSILFAAIILLILSSTASTTNIFAHILGLLFGIFLGKSKYFERLG